MATVDKSFMKEIHCLINKSRLSSIEAITHISPSVKVNTGIKKR